MSIASGLLGTRMSRDRLAAAPLTILAISSTVWLMPPRSPDIHLCSASASAFRSLPPTTQPAAMSLSASEWCSSTRRFLLFTDRLYCSAIRIRSDDVGFVNYITEVYHKQQKKMYHEQMNQANNSRSERELFHDWLESQGFRRPETPAANRVYPSSHIQTLWECWQASARADRSSSN